MMPAIASRPEMILGSMQKSSSRLLKNYLRCRYGVKNRLGKPLAANALQRDPKGERSE
jgi:hypothetical protein